MKYILPFCALFMACGATSTDPIQASLDIHFKDSLSYAPGSIFDVDTIDVREALFIDGDGMRRRSESVGQAIMRKMDAIERLLEVDPENQEAITNYEESANELQVVIDDLSVADSLLDESKKANPTIIDRVEFKYQIPSGTYFIRMRPDYTIQFVRKL